MKFLKRYVLVLFSLSQVAEVSAGTVSGMELLRRQQAAPSEAIVKYCRVNAPETEESITAAEKVYLASLEAALNAWIEARPQQRPKLQAALPTDSEQVKEINRSNEEMGARVIEGIKQYDAHQYCSWASEQMNKSTKEAILESLNEYDKRVQSVRKAGGQ